ncbi:MAG: radical SAM protein [Alphaproteobacteria bacterium]|nr:radical SAM protein [Alphaproteobacteria bacterium]
MLNYEEPLFRPPSEGKNLIIQTTIGCSHNKCAFCSMYSNKQFRIKPLEDTFKDIETASKFWPNAHRVFLADGDAMVLPMDHLTAILEKLNETFTNLSRVSIYASPQNLMKKSQSDLEKLKSMKLSLAYMGIESGSDLMLKKIVKGASAESHIEVINKTMDAGIRISGTMILGLGGKEHWKEHINKTAELINAAPPTFLSTLHLRLYEFNVKKYYEHFDNKFEHQDDIGEMTELLRLIEQLNPKKPIIFRSNHASNALPLAGNLPKDNERLIASIKQALNGDIETRPWFMREL